jgi:hypothetical protein
MNNVPCLRDRADGRRKFVFHDFGAELLQKLCAEKFADIDHVRRLLSTGEKAVSVRVRNLPPLEVHLTGQVALDPRRFRADLADCLVDAFRAKQLLH